MSLLFPFIFNTYEMQLWVYGHYKYFNFFSAGTDFIRQNLTSVDGPRAERVDADTHIFSPIIEVK